MTLQPKLQKQEETIYQDQDLAETTGNMIKPSRMLDIWVNRF